MSLPDVVPAVTPLKGVLAVRKGSDMYAVLAALHELPGIAMTTAELADETGLPVKQCSGYVYTLRKLGLVQSASASGQDGVRGTRYEHWVGERVL